MKKKNSKKAFKEISAADLANTSGGRGRCGRGWGWAPRAKVVYQVVQQAAPVAVPQPLVPATVQSQPYVPAPVAAPITEPVTVSPTGSPTARLAV
jgi:hypothetical protein